MHKKSYQHIRTYLFDVLSPFTVGKTYRGVCPSCGGSNSFTASVSEDMVMVYNCYRAGCEASGVLGLKLSAEDRILRIKNRKVLKVQSSFIKPNHWIDGIGSDECLHYMKRSNMYEAYQSGKFRPMYDPAQRRFIFPLYKGKELVGAVGRTLINKKPKALVYDGNYEFPFIVGVGDTLIIVEDCASAVASTRSAAITGLALLGTHIRKEYLPIISIYDKVLVALDADAKVKGLKIKKQLQAYVKDVKLILLKQDIKDMNTEDYLNTIKEYLTIN